MKKKMSKSCLNVILIRNESRSFMSESRGQGKRPIKKTPKMKSYNKTLEVKTPLPQ